MNDNRYKTKLHVSSETRKGSGDDTNEFRFDLPNGVSHLKKVTIAEAEIVNSMTPIHPGNHKVYFNEFRCFVVHKSGGSGNFSPTNPKLVFETNMYEATIPATNYNVDSMLKAVQSAMNTANVVYPATASTDVLRNVYTVTRPPGSMSLKPIIMATRFVGDYNDHNQTFSAIHNADFAVRSGNLPIAPVRASSAVWNAFDVDPTTLSGSINSTNIRNDVHCSPFRIILQLDNSHRFIPGDPIHLTFDDVENLQSNEVQIINSLSTSSEHTFTSAGTILQSSEIGGDDVTGFVAYVNGNEVHVFVKAYAKKKIQLSNCVVKLQNGVSGSQTTGCMELGLGRNPAQGLLVCSRCSTSLGDHSRTATPPIDYDARVYANASKDYMAFKYSSTAINPFVTGGTFTAINHQAASATLTNPKGAQMPVVTGTSSTSTNTTTGQILTDGPVTSNEITVSSSASIRNGDQVTYNAGSGAAINGLAEDDVYFVVEKNSNSFKLANNPGGSSLTISGGGSGNLLTLGFKIKSAGGTSVTQIELHSSDVGKLQEGDQVVYRMISAPPIDGLIPNVTYFVHAIDGNNIKLSSTRNGVPIKLGPLGSGVSTLTSIAPSTLLYENGAIYDVVQLDDFHFLQHNSMVMFSNDGAETETDIRSRTKQTHINKPSDYSAGIDNIRVPLISFLNSNIYDGVDELGYTQINPLDSKLIWTMHYKNPDNTLNFMKIGCPHVIGTENVDLTRNGRVAFIELEAVGIGPIGDLHLAGSDRTYFGRCQLDAGYLALTLNNDSIVGEYEFDNFVKPREMVIRLYDEKGEPLKTMGTHNSFLLELEGVGTYSGCR